MSGITVKVLRYPRDAHPDHVDPSQVQAKVKPLEEGADQAMQKVFGELRGKAVEKVRNVREGTAFHLRGYLARVDLTQCQVVVSSNRNHPRVQPERLGLFRSGIKIPDENYPQAVCTTEDWAEFNNLKLAINANFFQIPRGQVHKLEWTRTDGLSLSEGCYDQAPFQGKTNDKGTLSLLFTKNNEAHLIENFKVPQNHTQRPVSRSASTLARPTEWWNGVAGNWLVREGKIAEDLGPDPDMRHARTAVGVVDEGKGLLILMFELQTAMPRPAYPLYKVLNCDYDDTHIAYRAVDFQTLQDSLPRLGDDYTYSDDATLENDIRRKIPRDLLQVFDRHRDDHPPYGIGSQDTICLANRYNSRWKVKSNNQCYLIVGPKNFKDPRGPLQNVQGFEVCDISHAMTERRLGFDISVGVTLPELSQLMIVLGVKNAINLDGSGSSSFIYNPTDVSGSIVNSYHDHVSPETYFHSQDPDELNHLESFLKPRPAGNHLGFR